MKHVNPWLEHNRRLIREDALLYIGRSAIWMVLLLFIVVGALALPKASTEAIDVILSEEHDR